MAKGLPPLWKVKRELKRFPVSLFSKSRAALSPLHRLRYDLTAKRRVRITDGDRPVTAEPVVLLIYQPKKLLGSIFLTLEHLVKNGLSVILVANHPLDDEKLEALRPWCHKMIARPNLGYDFGGYREGVRFVLREMPEAERLFVLNDSNWFPATGDSDLIATARTAPENIYGIFQYNLPRRPEDRHLQSYFYRFDKQVIRSTFFHDYWKKLPLLEEKRLVVRYREVGLSKSFRRAGFTLGSYHSPADVLEAGVAMPAEDLRQVLTFLLEHDFIEGQDVVWLSTASDEEMQDRERVRAILEASNFPMNYLATHPVLNMAVMKSPILKKNRDTIFRSQRVVLRDGPLRSLLHPVVQQELDIWGD